MREPSQVRPHRQSRQDTSPAHSCVDQGLCHLRDNIRRTIERIHQVQDMQDTKHRMQGVHHELRYVQQALRLSIHGQHLLGGLRTHQDTNRQASQQAPPTSHQEGRVRRQRLSQTGLRTRPLAMPPMRQGNQSEGYSTTPEGTNDRPHHPTRSRRYTRTSQLPSRPLPLQRTEGTPWRRRAAPTDRMTPPPTRVTPNAPTLPDRGGGEKSARRVQTFRKPPPPARCRRHVRRGAMPPKE